MKSATKHLLLLAGLATMQTSCSLPPSQAWKIVSNQGLIPYLAMETGRRPFPSGVTPSRREAAPLSRPAGLAAPTTSPTLNRYLATPNSSAPVVLPPRTVSVASVAPRSGPVNVPTPAPTLRLTTTAPKPRMSAAPKPPVKTLVPPPAPQKPVPNASTNATNSNSAPVKAPVKAPAPQVAQPAPKPSTPSAPKPSTPAPAPAAAPQTAAAPTPAPQAAPAPAAPQVSATGIPYGTPIPGRPGLVNSPYASKHQIVDITGLQAGQEIKCPYTGRLFLVPPGQVSVNKATAPGAPKP